MGTATSPGGVLIAPRPAIIESRAELAIARSPAEVFSYLVDPDRLGEWIDNIVEAQAPGTPRVGATYRVVVQIGGRLTAVQGEIIEFDPPYLLTFRGMLPSMSFTGTWRLDPRPRGCGVEYTATTRLDGPMVSLMAPLMRVAVNRRHRRSLARLKAAIEGELEQSVHYAG